MFFVISQTGTNCIAQSASQSGIFIEQTKLNVNEQPFDKLELFSFFAAGPVAPYASYMVQKRGTNFTPDSRFISSFSPPIVRSILQNIKARTNSQESPDRDQAFELVKKAFESQKNHLYVPAGESYRQALKLAPDSATLHLAYAASLLLSQNFAPADEQIRASIKLWPENSEAHAMLALFMVLQKRSAEAEMESKEALRIFPHHMSAKFTLAQSLTHEHKYVEAIPAIRSAISVWPSMNALTKFLGIALMETGDTTAGIEQLNAYVKVAPDDAEGHYFLGVALRAKGINAEAHAQFAEAIRLQPQYLQYQAAANPDSVSTLNPIGGLPPESGSFSANAYSNRFFGFVYSFPQGLSVLSTRSAHTLFEDLVTRTPTNDPASEDIKRIEPQLVHTLIYASSIRKEMPVKLTIVSAIDERFENHVSAASYADAVLQRVVKSGAQGEIRGVPEEVTVGGRKFWKDGYIARNGVIVRYGSEFIVEMKGYLLVFAFGAPDLGNLSQMEKSLETLQFQPNTN